MANYKISEIEGIGPVYSQKLSEAGINTVNDLLDKGAAKKGRAEVASATGIDEKIILKWVNMSELFRLKGIGSEYAELLEKAGVDTVKELRNRNADNLTEKMKEVNSEGRALVRALPSANKVQQWIDDAKKLDPRVTY